MKKFIYIFALFCFFSDVVLSMLPPPPPPAMQGGETEVEDQPVMEGVKTDMVQMDAPMSQENESAQQTTDVQQEMAQQPVEVTSQEEVGQMQPEIVEQAPQEQQVPPATQVLQQVQEVAPTQTGNASVIQEPIVPGVEPELGKEPGVSSQPQSPPVPFTQEEWPNAIELTEKKDESLLKTKVSSEILFYVEEADNMFNEIQSTIKDIYLTRKYCEEPFIAIDRELDLFFNKIGFFRGTEDMKIEISAENVASNVTEKEVAIFKVEWNQVKTDIETIDLLENDLLAILKVVDEQIQKIVGSVSFAKRLNLEILNSQNKAQAKAKLEKLRMILRKVRNLQNYIQRDFKVKFQEIINKIKVRMDLVEKGVNNLKQHGIKFSGDIGVLPADEVVEIEQEVLEEEMRKPRSKIFTAAVNFVAFFISIIRKIGNWIYDVFTYALKKSSKGQSVSVEIEKKDTVAPGTVIPPSNSSQKPNMQNGELKKKSKDTEDQIINKIKTGLNKIDKSIMELDAEREIFIQKREHLEELKNSRSDQLKKKLKVMENLEATLGEELQFGPEGQEFNLKQSLLKGFGKILDAGAFIVNKINMYSIIFYQKFLKTKTLDFIAAVEARVNQLNEEKQKVDTQEKSGEIVSEEKIAEPIQVNSVSPPHMADY